MHRRSCQRGMSMWALLGLLIVFGFVALMAIRLVPVYLTYWNVVSISQSVRADVSSDTNMTEVWDKFRTRFNLNGIRDLEPRKVLDVRRHKGSISVHIKYQVHRPLVANVGLTASFDRTIGG